MSISISDAVTYFHWNLKRDITYVNTSANTNIKAETIIH